MRASALILVLLSLPLTGIGTHIAARRVELRDKGSRAQKLYAAGRYAEAAAGFELAANEARSLNQLDQMARYLGNLGTCRFLLQQHKEALDAYLEARRTSAALRDAANVSVLGSNLSSLYADMGQIEEAVHEGESALAALDRVPERERYEPRLLIQMAELRSRQGRQEEALQLFERGIGGARAGRDYPTTAIGLDRLGQLRLRRKEFAAAESAMLEALGLRRGKQAPSLDLSLRELALLRLAQGDLRAASRLADEAIAAPKSNVRVGRLFLNYLARGRVRLAEGRLEEANGDLQTALAQSRRWRLSALASDSSRVGIESGLHDAYSLAIEVGNRLYRKTGERRFARETFELAEENRAASLKALLSDPGDWRAGLPPEYWQSLAAFQSAEAKLLSEDNAATRAEVRRLETLLSAAEAKAGGVGPAVQSPRLDEIQGRLAADAALFTFHLAASGSYVWAISREDFEVYPLPRAAAIPALAESFRKEIEKAPAAAVAGSALYSAMFGPIGRKFLDKPAWILALDGALFAAPLAALPVPPQGFLIERHSIQVVSAASAKSGAGHSARFSGAFLGIGDAIYNGADPRLPAGAPRSDRALPLARLAGSGREVEACARLWTDAKQPAVLLTGSQASRARLAEEIRKDPAVVHFATHVLRAVNSPTHALIALSLTPSGENEFAGAREIAAMRTGAGLVVLSGCSSGAGETVPASGLMGLTRAWLAAGAGAVIASHWPTPDDSGELFLSLYRHLSPERKVDSAAALQMAQIAMLRGGGWRASPRYWGAYFVLGNY
jgi:CHAT domain-containing protein